MSKQAKQARRGKPVQQGHTHNFQSYTTSQSVPQPFQKQLLKHWMGLARFAYNSVVK